MRASGPGTHEYFPRTSLAPVWLLSGSQRGSQHSGGISCCSVASPGPRAISKLLSSLGQFDCTNTLNDQTLENVTVQMEPTEAYEVLCYVPARSLPYNQPGTCYTLVALPKEDPTTGKLHSKGFWSFGVHGVGS